MVLPKHKTAAVAIDFGTSCSGSAYAFITNSDENVNIYVHDSWAGGGCVNSKTVTVISLDQHGRLSKFGYDAREDHGNAIFSNYKMVLFNSVSREKTMVKADNCDQTASVEWLITETLRFFGQTVLERINNARKNKIHQSDVLWVITVPAIWDDAAKQIMRQCAIKAGLCTIADDKESLLLAYEPESGAMDCIFERTRLYHVEVGQTVLVCDLGGGTVDFTVYRQLADGKIESIVRPFGGNYGSTYSNARFKDFLLDLFGFLPPKQQEIINSLDFITLLDRFEIVKRSMCSSESCSDDKPRIIAFSPRTIDQSIEWFIGRVNDYNHRHQGAGLEYKRSGHLYIPLNTFMELFLNPLFKSIIDCIKDQMNTNPAICNPTHIFMIGGFSENYFLQQLIKKEFGRGPGGENVIIPLRPSLCVVKGACRFGLRPWVVTKRIVQKSYALEVDGLITADTPHNGRQQCIINGKPYAKNVCDVFVKAGESIGLSESKTKTFVPTSENQQVVELAIFTSHLAQMDYTTNPAISFAGDLTLAIPPGDTLEDRKVDVTLEFGATEVFVTARHVKTGVKVNSSIKFAMTNEEIDRRNKIRLEKTKPLSVQLCICMDITGSMQSWINEAKNKMVQLAKVLSNAYAGIQFEVSFVGYRDYTDPIRFENIAFSSNMEVLEQGLAKIVASGGGDIPEDVVGGFQHVLLQEWKEGYTKVCIHVADAPCHGTKYHDFGAVSDSLPHGDTNVPPEEQIKTMKNRGIDYYFIKINHQTDRMIEEFRKTYDTDQKKIVVANLGSDVTKLIPSLVSFVSNSITQFVSIDFGTSCSGYAYSFITENNVDIYVHDSWPGGGSTSLKTLTLISIDVNGKLVKFGYDAREDHDNAIFSNFKMVLFDSESREKTMVKADNCDQTASVETLITETLKFFKQTSLERINNGNTNAVEPSQVLWVITVPAIWDDAAKQIMRRCAISAGLCTIANDKESLILAYEPESGAMDCIFEKTNNYSVEAGQIVLVFDIGGGTADFTVYKQLADGKIEGIVRPFGGNFGSTYCNKNFKKFMLDLLGDEVTQDMIDGTDFMALMDRFESAKKSMCDSSANDGKPRYISFNPRVFDKNIDWLLQRIQKYNAATTANIEYKRSGHLVIPMESFMTFLQPLFHKIVDCVKQQMLQNDAIKKPNFIFMIGGFSDNYFLQELVKREFASTGARIIVPTRPSLSVVKGACRFGLRPSVITKRTIQRSYAVEVIEEMTPEKHVGRQPYLVNGKLYANNSVGIDEIVTRGYGPVSAAATSVNIAIFTSLLSDIKYTTEPGISFAAEIKIPVPPGDNLEDKSVIVTMKFGATEVFVSAIQIKTLQKIDATIEFAMTREEAERRNKERLGKYIFTVHFDIQSIY
ncbi:hypothetical protein DFA_11453 [Cavenderia fasciculata]|uniref:Hemicentin-1-like von Willebrand factor A domain-containing protein n=1 Tax=Cavenderia fasciculata TaxID=261658 RepID=F4QD11_CACFS|nr:uncharacterized protein DFA_11453 [Cavenderia fasciculata]EGG13692.1 hypothetical protein DFA_11453 [Cavenderia fasciculata]|eukprot:XP_004350396.1 hypothetical protein DFA_11453 [Cavenderia fasciculata]